MCYKQEPFETEEYKGYTIKLYPDIDPINPREWDNLGTFADFLKREKIGDEHNFDNPLEMIESIALECNPKRAQLLRDMFDNDNLSEEEYQEKMYALAKQGTVIIPVYAYIHSGITISTERGYPYNDAWDSGCAGYIYATYPKIREEFSCKHITKKLRERIATLLRGEIETLDDYLTGNVCGFVIENAQSENVNSIWGFYPNNDPERPRNVSKWAYVLQEARAMIDYRIKQKQKEYAAHEQENEEFQYV